MELHRYISGDFYTYEVTAETDLSYVGKTTYVGFENHEFLFDKSDLGIKYFLTLEELENKIESDKAKEARRKELLDQLEKEFA